MSQNHTSQISEKQIKWFFNNMKDRKILPQIAELYNWSIEPENIQFRYQVGGKTFGYKMCKSSVLIFLREWKLNQFFSDDSDG
jgi:hypothetical protein